MVPRSPLAATTRRGALGGSELLLETLEIPSLRSRDRRRIVARACLRRVDLRDVDDADRYAVSDAEGALEPLEMLAGLGVLAAKATNLCGQLLLDGLAGTAPLRVTTNPCQDRRYHPEVFDARGTDAPTVQRHLEGDHVRPRLARHASSMLTSSSSRNRPPSCRASAWSSAGSV